MTTQTCPEQEHLQAMLADQLPEERLLQLAQHLRDCASCQARFEKLAERVDLLAPVPASDSDAFDAREPELQRVIRSLHSQRPSTVATAATVDSPREGTSSHGRSSDRMPDLTFLSSSENPASLGRLGTLDVLEVIGRGGMGVVLRGQDTKLNRAVAIKVLAPGLARDAIARERFRREAQAAAAVSHEHVVPIHAIDEMDGIPFIVMAYIEGVSLEQRIRRDGPLELKKILRIGAQTAAGLAAAHAQGLVHRDIKPGNILLENGVERVKVTDFGLARAVDDLKITRTDTVAGTPEYMSPQQAGGETVDHRSDLFSLGCVLYAMCTGRSPFRASSVIDAIRRVCDDEPRSVREVNSEIPEFLARIIDRLLCKDPDQRFQSAAEVAELLEGHLAHLQRPDVAPKPAPVSAVKSARSPAAGSNTWGWIAALATVVAACLFLVVVGVTVACYFQESEGGSGGAGRTPPAATEPLEQASIDDGLELMAMAKEAAGREDKERLYEKAVKIFEQHDDKVNQFACMRRLAWLAAMEWDYTAAIPQTQRALAVYRSAPKDFHGMTGPSLASRDLATFYCELGNEEGEVDVLREMMREASRDLGDVHSNTFYARMRLALRLPNAQVDAEMRQLFTGIKEDCRMVIDGRSDVIWSKAFDEYHFAIAVAHLLPLGEASTEELALAENIVKNYESSRYAWLNFYRALWFRARGDLQKAQTAAEKARVRWKRHIDNSGGNDLRVALRVDDILFDVLTRLHDPSGVESALRTSIERRDIVLPANHPQRAYPRQQLAELVAEDHPEEAQGLLLEAYGILKSQPMTPDRRWNACVEQLAAKYKAAGDAESAEEYLMQLRPGESDNAPGVSD